MKYGRKLEKKKAWRLQLVKGVHLKCETIARLLLHLNVAFYLETTHLKPASDHHVERRRDESYLHLFIYFYGSGL